MKHLSPLYSSSLYNQRAYYALLGSGNFIILSWYSNILDGLFSRFTQIIIFIFPYWALVIVILVKYCRRLRSFSESSPLDRYRGLVLPGFATHSLSYASLLLPPIVPVEIMAGYPASEGVRLSHQPGATRLSEV
jgi:hypothetical protein